MGNNSPILWLSPELARAYYLTVTVALLGLLQILALRWGHPDLRWLPPRWAAPVGVVMIISSVATYYHQFYSLIFVPGPAGLELMLLFGGASITALWLTRLLGAFVRHFGRGGLSE